MKVFLSFNRSCDYMDLVINHNGHDYGYRITLIAKKRLKMFNQEMSELPLSELDHKPLNVKEAEAIEKELNPVAEMVQTAVVGLDKPMPRESQRLTGLTDEYKKVTTTSTNTAV